MCLLLQFCLCVTISRPNKKHCNLELSLKLVRWTKAQYSKVCAWDSLFHRGNELDESIDISSTIQVFLFLCSALCLYLSLFPLNTRLPYSYLCLHRLFTSKRWYQYYSHTVHKRRHKWLHPWNSFSFSVLDFVLFSTLSRNCCIPGRHGRMKSSFFQEDTYYDYQISLQRNKEVRHDRLRVASLSGTTPPPSPQYDSSINTTLPLLIAHTVSQLR